MQQTYGYSFGYAERTLGDEPAFQKKTGQHYGYFHTDLFYQKYYPHGHRLVARLGGQWSSTSYLRMVQQFYPGGLTTVRGYKENLLFGDSGAAAGLDYLIPIDRRKRFFFDLFTDGGFVTGPGTEGQGDTRIASCGFGLRGVPIDHMHVDIYMGFPLVKTLDGVEQSPRVNFLVDCLF